jgi:hypothetical protein
MLFSKFLFLVGCSLGGLSGIAANAGANDRIPKIQGDEDMEARMRDHRASMDNKRQDKVNYIHLIVPLLHVCTVCGINRCVRVCDVDIYPIHQ